MSDQMGTLGIPPRPAAGRKGTTTSGHEKWANKIDPHFRKEMLELQVIDNAQPIEGNESMAYLINIYKNYIDPQFSAACAKCLARVLKHFRAMRPILKALEKNANLLKSL